MPDPDTLVVAPSNVEQARAWNGAEGDYWAGHDDWFNRSMAGYQPAFMAAARIGRTDRVLDVGCGTGQTTREAARRAAAGSALGVDLSARMIDVARRRAAAEGAGNARFEQADAQVHPFPPDAFDVAISRAGAMFFGDPPAAFSGIRRALRPGGRLTLLTWQPVARNEWFGALWTALTGRTALPAPPPGAPGPFSLGDPEGTRALLGGAGFTDIEITGVSEPLDFGPGVAEAERFLLDLLGWMLHDRDDPERGRAALRRSLTDHLGPAGVHYGSAGWLVTAHRP